jgi:hypothetical protein
MGVAIILKGGAGRFLKIPDFQGQFQRFFPKGVVRVPPLATPMLSLL